MRCALSETQIEMALPTNYSLLSAVALALLTIAGMQVFKDEIAMEGNLWRLALGGFVGSWFFVFILTAVGNVYTLLFTADYAQVKLFPEAILCLVAAVLVSGSVHRICATTCIIFSMVALYYINKIPQSSLSTPAPPTATASTRQSKRQSGKNRK